MLKRKPNPFIMVDDLEVQISQMTFQPDTINAS